MNFWRKSEKNLHNIYDSIETLPIWNWNKIQNTSNLDFLLINKSNKKNKYVKDLESIWLKIQNEYIDRYDVSDVYKKLIEIKSNIALHKIDFYLYNKKVARTYWRIEEIKLKDLLSDKETSFESSLIAIKRYMGFNLNPKTTTVMEYFDYIKEING